MIAMTKKNQVTAAEIFDRARELVESCWIQGFLALNADGDAVPPVAADACGYCADGARRRAAFELIGEGWEESEQWERTCQILTRLGFSVASELEEWNDEEDRTIKDVIALFNTLSDEAREHENA